MKNTSLNSSIGNASALDALHETNIFFFELTLYVLYSLIFLFGIFGNSVVIYVLLSSIFFDKKHHQAGITQKEQTTIINSPNTNSLRSPQDTPKRQLNSIRDQNKLYTLLRKFLKEKLTVTSFYLLNLAITDFFYVLFIPVLLCTMLTNRWLFGFLFCKVYFSMVYLCQCSSVFILVVLSVDRYLSVRYPLKTSTFRSDELSRAVILTSWLLSFLFIIPVIIYTEYQSVNSSCHIHWPEHWNFLSSRNHSSFSHIANTYLSPFHLFNIYTFLLNYLIPVSIIVILYTQILKNLQKNSQKNTATNRSKSKRKSHKHITKMVLAIIICYITCWTPYWCYQITIYVYNQIFKIEPPFILIIISHFVQVIAYMSSALNPFIYSYMSEAFRINLNSAFNCCRRKAEYGIELKEIHMRKDNPECKVLIKDPVVKEKEKTKSLLNVRVDSVTSVTNDDKESVMVDGQNIFSDKEQNFLDEKDLKKQSRPRKKFMSLSATQPDYQSFGIQRQTGSANNIDNKKFDSKIPIKKLTFLNSSNSKFKFEINFHGLKYFKR